VLQACLYYRAEVEALTRLLPPLLLVSNAGPASPPLIDEHVPDVSRRTVARVVFQKWRWTEIAVTLGLIFIASMRKEWPMTFIRRGARPHSNVR